MAGLVGFGEELIKSGYDIVDFGVIKSVICCFG